MPMYMLSRHVRNNGIKVVLDGRGADEVFLGYNIFKEHFLEKNGTNSNPERAKVISSLYPYLKHYKNDKSSKMLHALYENFSKEANPFSLTKYDFSIRASSEVTIARSYVQDLISNG